MYFTHTIHMRHDVLFVRQHFVCAVNLYTYGKGKVVISVKHETITIFMCLGLLLSYTSCVLGEQQIKIHVF